MSWVLTTLERLPELVLFLTVGLGYAIGAVKIGKFALGTVMAALLIGLVVGQVTAIQPSRELRWALFLMFMFANGYIIGPQFARGLKSGGSEPLVLSVVVTMTALGVTCLCARWLELDAGLAAGLFSGAMTSASAMGTATDAIRALDLEPELREVLASNVSVANALTYVGGAIGMVVFVSTIAPWLLGVDLPREAARLEARLGIRGDVGPGIVPGYQRFGVRAFRLERAELVGSSVADIERRFPEWRYFIERIGRNGEVFDAAAADTLRSGDAIVVYGRSEALILLAEYLGREMHDAALTNFPLRTMTVVVTNPELVGKPLERLVSSPMPDFRSVGLRSIVRGGVEVPFGPGSTLDRGDVVELTGPQRAVERAVGDIGYALHPSARTNLAMIGIGIGIGALAGVPSIRMGGLELTIGLTVGVLAMGLTCGWLRAVRPTFGSLPEPAARLMIDFGLAAFVAAAGLEAGPYFVDAFAALGPQLIAAGMAVTIAPQLIALLVGRYVLRMNAILLLGGIAGAQTFTAALAALQERCGSAIPAVGYTVPYAASNVLLTACGTLIVTLLA